MASPNQSLLLHVGEKQNTGDEIDLGVRVSTQTGEALSPGADFEAELSFWDDLADLHIVPGRRFTLRYPTRVVGTGEVLEVLSF